MKSERWRQSIPVAISLAIFAAALHVLRVELHAVSWRELTDDIAAIPASRIAAALTLTVLNYAVLTGYDLVAFAYIRKRLSRRFILATSFLAYAISNNIGLAMLSGASVRYRFYTRQGVTALELSRIVFSYSVTFWLGLLALGGLSLTAIPLPAAALPASRLGAAAGWLLMLIPVAYLAAARVRRRPLRLWKLELPMPSPRIAAAQLGLSAVDWALAGAVLYVLLPAVPLGFLPFLGIFLVSILIGMISHVPGGIGVFEGLMVLLLKPYMTSGELVPALIVYRAIYFLLPLTVAAIALVVDEVHRRRGDVARMSAVVGRLAEQLTPRVLAVMTFLGGVLLLFSGATPSIVGRLELLDRVVPLGVIEASHFLASVAGVGLLLLSQGLARRLDGAYYLSLGLIAVGIVSSLLKGFDYEEAALLSLILLLLYRARSAFERRAAFFETRFSPAWTASLLGAVGSSIWLGFFAYKHVEYSRQLWWQFELRGDASRFLRASVGVAIVLLVAGVARLIGYAPHDAPPPSDADMADAARAIAAQTSTFPNLVFLRDKALLFDETRRGFVMYGVQGRTWVALGDPVGPDDTLTDVVRLFLERCSDYGGIPVFYEVTPLHLHRYADFGLVFVKLGEAAKVDLTTFTLEGSAASKRRQALRRLEKDGRTFRIVPPCGVSAILDDLRAVSDDWLAHKATAEKGFSLGFFDDDYVGRFPVAVIECDGRIEAFATVWTGPEHIELSVDMMRYARTAPRSVMEALFVHMMQWGKDQGYQRFALGMAPLSGFELSPVRSLWNRIGTFLYEHGTMVYNFQGLRAFKEKFDPIWEPHYLAYPGGFHLPRILADVSALVAGGYRRIFLKP